MRLCRYGNNQVGLVEDSHVRDITAALDVLPHYRYPLPTHDVLIANLDRVLERARSLPHGAMIPLTDVTLLSPVANPGKIIAAPVNYQAHFDEAQGDQQIRHGKPILDIRTAGVFLKAPSSLVGPGEGIRLRKLDRRNDHEVELAVIISRTASNISRDEALQYVAGYAIGLDITIRGPEERSLRKSPDSYCVLGPWMVTADEIPAPGRLDLGMSVNGEVRQSANTNQMILGVPELLELASSFYTLQPGDVMITGTPAGVSPIQPGDRISASIERIGSMDVMVTSF
jgi:2-keto-4-pentenoate hydratase/2-oxohepta-3-ene-1,7-dioic acid hydratase in catechol pathway